MDLLQNALLQGLTYGPAVLGIVIAFRVLRYPDLTPDGSYIIGAALYASLIVAGYSPWFATVVSTLGGAACGVLTAALHYAAGVNRLLSGILSSMICYSLAFRVLGKRSNVPLLTTRSIFDGAASWDKALRSSDAAGAHWWGSTSLALASLAMLTIIAFVVALLLLLVFRSDLGLALRASGANVAFLRGVGRRPGLYVTLGLTIANACVALSAALAAARQGFADVNGGVGIVVVLIAALVFGEEITRRVFRASMRPMHWRFAAALIGAFAYYLSYLFILRASIRSWIPVSVQPTDLKMLSAVLIAILYASRRKSMRAADELLPL